VGRAGELGELVTYLRDPQAGGAVLVGAGGVGKTRLANACIDVAANDGLATATVVATRAASRITLGALAPLLPPLGDRTVNLLVAARDALRERSGGKRLVLFVDDAHLLDDASASLVLQLAVNREVFVLATVRAGEDLSGAITGLWKDGHTARVDVRPLPEDDLDCLIAESLGSDVDNKAHTELRRISRGNPLALRELILGAIESGSLTRDEHGGWGLTGPFGISERLTDLVEERLGSLDAAESEAIEFVALGEPVAIDVLEQLARPAAVESIERKGIIAVRETDGRLEAWLDHPLFGEVLRANVGRLRTRNVLHSLADALERSDPKRPSDLLRLATWRLESGSRAEPELLLRAARQARAVNEVDLACRICEAAWAGERTAAIGELLSYSLCDLGRFEEAEAVLDETSTLISGDEGRANVTIIRAEMKFRTGDAAGAIATARDVVPSLHDPIWRAVLEAHLATLLMLMGRAQDALALVDPLLESGWSDPVNGAALVAGTVLTWDGRPVDAMGVHERAYERCVAVQATGSFTIQDDASIQLVGMIQALTQAGRLGEAEEMLDIAWREVTEQHSTIPMAWISLLQALHGLAAGRPEEALSWAGTSVELWQSSGLFGRLRWPLAVMAQALAWLGRGEEATHQIERMDSVTTPVRLNEASILEARAWVLAANGSLEDARTMLLEAARLGIEMGQRTCALAALHALARLGAQEKATEQVRWIRSDVQGPLMEARIEHIESLVSADPEELVAVSEKFEKIGSCLCAAEAAADAARAYRKAGRAREATSAAKRARMLTDRCGGARTPALALAETASPLTRREREVVILASQGLASKAIAERLYVSVRTVDNHLSRAYDKLGVSGRSGLAAVEDQLSG